MHLAIVSPFPPSITGIGQYGYHIARALSESAAFLRITVLAGAKTSGAQNGQLKLTTVEYCWRLDDLRASASILSSVRRLNPDVVWFNLGASIFGKSPLSNLAGLLTPMLVRREFPTVITLHELMELADLRTLNAPGGAFAEWGARALTRFMTQADVVCLTTQYHINWLTARGIDCAHIPIGAYSKPSLLTESRLPELLFFSTLAPHKGVELLLDAVDILRTEYPQLHLTIAGAEHSRFPNYARGLQRRYKETQGVRWLGLVSEEKVRDLFSCAQIVVLPYRASTGSSSVLHQAATWGRAVVMSDLPELQELARESNLLVQFFESGNVSSLCAAIRTLLASPALGRAQAEHNFMAIQSVQPQEISRRYIHAFNRALERRQSVKRIPITECG